MRNQLLAVLLCGLSACVGSVPDGSGGQQDPDDPTDPEGTPDGGFVEEACAVPTLAPDSQRPVSLAASDVFETVQAAMPCVSDPALRELLESPNTILYDDTGIVPGYQDSFGDNVIAPIGMRPNTIRSNLIDLAVPGGHAQIFESKGVFHFPFGRPIGSPLGSVEVVNFWHVPSSGGQLLPVVWWQRDPNNLTHRVEWLFPVGTVLGELMFMVDDDGSWHPFEIRTRERLIDEWRVNAYRPFPVATDLADALEELDTGDADVEALIAHLRDTTTVEPVTIRASHFSSAFPDLEGARDVLPPLADDSVIEQLLAEVGFRSARDQIWKDNAGLLAHAASTDDRSSLSIVPPDYNAGSFAITEQACSRCHMDAGRPFETWYDNITAYGELWGGDEAFTWHPFTTGNFVNSDGSVNNFNYDNREIRSDFSEAGLIEAYDSNKHSDSIYAQIPREWTNFAY